MKSFHFTTKAGMSILAGALVIGALGMGGCGKRVRDIKELPAERAATIRVEVNTTSQGKILQEEIRKGVWRLSRGAARARRVGKYEWYLWMGIDDAIYPLIPKGQSFVTNVSLIHEGDTARLTREYAVPTGEHRYLLGFAGMRPFAYRKGLGRGGDDDGGDTLETRLGVTWKQCFKVRLKAREVITVRVDDRRYRCLSAERGRGRAAVKL